MQRKENAKSEILDVSPVWIGPLNSSVPWFKQLLLLCPTAMMMHAFVSILHGCRCASQTKTFLIKTEMKCGDPDLKDTKPKHNRLPLKCLEPVPNLYTPKNKSNRPIKPDWPDREKTPSIRLPGTQICSNKTLFLSFKPWPLKH